MDRYARQTLLTQIGEEGQKRLAESKVTVIGCGALGSSTAEHLVRAGVGDMVIVDRDFVELDNLQRQHLFTEKDVGEPKAVVAEERLRSINSAVTITGVVEDVNPVNGENFIRKRDIVLDGTDNLNARFLINDLCIKHGVPWVYGACVGVQGMSMNIMPEGPCLQCFVPQIPVPGSIPTCDTVGIINTLPTVVSGIQSTEALKVLVGEKVDSYLTVVDMWEKEFRRIEVAQREDCPCCVRHSFEYLRPPEKVTLLCGRNAVQVTPVRGRSLSLRELAEKLRSYGEVKVSEHILFFFVDRYTLSIFPDGRAIIKGTNDEEEAEALYAYYVGVE